MFRIGFECGLGFICAMALFITVSKLIGDIVSRGRDGTDQPWGRSGLKLYTDHATGVQYVGRGNGVTVRVDASGAPIVVRTDQESDQ